jgi:hypothetical protein
MLAEYLALMEALAAEPRLLACHPATTSLQKYK